MPQLDDQKPKTNPNCARFLFRESHDSFDSDEKSKLGVQCICSETQKLLWSQTTGNWIIETKRDIDILSSSWLSSYSHFLKLKNIKDRWVLAGLPQDYSRITPGLPQLRMTQDDIKSTLGKVSKTINNKRFGN